MKTRKEIRKFNKWIIKQVITRQMSIKHAIKEITEYPTLPF